jgi:predicted HAD superfamily Cof-like phosphohydrolase
MSSYELTREFHRAVGHPVANQPRTSIPEDRLKLRANLIASEFAELIAALAGYAGSDPFIEFLKRTVTDVLVNNLFGPDGLRRGMEVDLVEVARQIADLHIVVSGTALEFGIPEPAVIEEVHAANMRKVGGPKREDGKQLRPEGWEPPNVARVLEEAVERTEPLR